MSKAYFAENGDDDPPPNPPPPDKPFKKSDKKE